MELQLIQNRIFELRGHRVMLDYHLAELYEVETKALNLAVKRNSTRFPDDFMFQLTKNEVESLRLQLETLEKSHFRYLPYVFTEQGVAMLSSVLRSEKAIAVNIAIMRAFVTIRQHLTDFDTLKTKIEALEQDTDQRFKDVYEALDYLLNPQNARRLIGFGRGKEEY
jgi:tRNA isopentenyl-2-thiomethyl-A-37 hydroxylase MiaE